MQKVAVPKNNDSAKIRFKYSKKDIFTIQNDTYYEII